jgi:hypothetical protein
LGRGAADVATRTKTLDTKKLQIALQAIAKKVESGGTLRVGFLAGAMYPAETNERFLKAVGSKATPKLMPPVSVAQVAFWNEFGTKTAPKRSFFRTTIAQESKRWGEHLGKALPHYNYNGELALRAIGQEMRDDLEAQIQRWDEPDNAPLTIKIKGFNKPLTDRGILARSPDFEIVK